MKNKNVLKGITTTLALTITLSSVVSGAKFTDVPEGHWAYPAVTYVSENKIIVGDLSGKFNLDEYIDKFRTSKILARIIGYTYETGATEEEKAELVKIYEKHKATVDSYKNKYAKWNSTSDMEIAYLLEKGIYKTEDLDHFIIINKQGKEQLRALSREEMAEFLVRILGAEQEAENADKTNLFDDDSSITQSRKNAVYYLRQIGVVSGDSHNKYLPKGAVTNATLAVFLYKTLPMMDEYKEDALQQNNSSLVTGVIEEVFPSLYSVQINVDGQTKVYKTGSGLNLASLVPGQSVTLVIENNTAVALSGTTAVEVTTQATTSAPAFSKSDYTQIEGWVDSVTDSSLSVMYRILNPRDEIIDTVKTYSIAPNCTVYRGSELVTRSEINIDEVVTVNVVGTTAYEIYLDQKDKAFNGTLLEKKSSDGKPVLKIESDNGKVYELNITDDTLITRKNAGLINWTELKVGDSLTVKAEYSNITELDSEGVKSTVEGIVSTIYMDENSTKVTVKVGNREQEYILSKGAGNRYSFKVGDRVSLKLESKEVTSINVTEANGDASVQGYVDVVKSDYFVLLTGSENRKIYMDEDTKITDAKDGDTVSALKENSKVYVSFDNDNTNVARTVTILEY